MAMIRPLVVPAIKTHTSTIILAHGLGDSGVGWSFLPEMWRADNHFQSTKFILPSAPNIPITVNGGMRMPGWYDITDFGDLANRTDDEAGIEVSKKYFHSLIEEEIKAGIPSEKIIVGGFSQGAAMSIVSGLTAPEKLGGIFALSGYLLLKNKLRDAATETNKATPIFMGHGTADPVVRFDWGRLSAAELKKWGYNVDFNAYEGLPHSAEPKELEDLRQFISQRLTETADKQ